VSFSVPQRKKLRLEWVSSTKEGTGGVRAIGGDGGVEFGCGWADIGMFTLLGRDLSGLLFGVQSGNLRLGLQDPWQFHQENVRTVSVH
jgi:hypothetical protein